MLCTKPVVSALLHLLAQYLELAHHAATFGQTPHDEPTRSRFAAVMGKAQEVESLGPPQTAFGPPFGRKAAKLEEPGFVLVQRESELDQSVPQGLLAPTEY